MASAARTSIIYRTASHQSRIISRIQPPNYHALNVRLRQTSTAPEVREKYREKLEAKAKSEGLGSFEELQESYKDKIAKVRKEFVQPPLSTALPGPPPPYTRRSPQPLPIVVNENSNHVPPGVKTLSSFVDVDKLSLHSDPKEIEFIWRARFLGDKDSLCAIIPRDVYQRLEDSARRFPMFVLPLIRPSGAEIHFLQWSFPAPQMSTIIFTTLAEYRLHGEFANPHTTISHHLELAEEKGVVLAQGAVTPDRGVSVDEAMRLVVALQKFYGAVDKPSEKRRRLLEMFSRGEIGFAVEELIEEVEKLE